MKLALIALSLVTSAFVQANETYIGHAACDDFLISNDITVFEACQNYAEEYRAGKIYQCNICGCGSFRIDDPGMLRTRAQCTRVISNQRLLKVLRGMR